MTDLNKNIGSLIKKLRSDANMTQKDLSAKLNISFQQLQKYENGSNRVSSVMLFAIAKILNQDISIFLPEEKNNTLLFNDSVVSKKFQFESNTEGNSPDLQILIQTYKSISDNKMQKLALETIMKIADACKKD